MAKRRQQRDNAVIFETDFHGLPGELKCTVMVASGVGIFAWACVATYFRALITEKNLLPLVPEFLFLYERVANREIRKPPVQALLRQLWGPRLVQMQPRHLYLHEKMPGDNWLCLLPALAPSLHTLCLDDSKYEQGLQLLQTDVQIDQMALPVPVPELAPCIAALSQLRTLQLHYAFPNGASLAPIASGLTTLEQLVCEPPCLHPDNDVDYLLRMTALQHLNLGGWPGLVTHKHLAALPNLRSVMLSREDVSAALAPLTHLQRLYLSDSYGENGDVLMPDTSFLPATLRVKPGCALYYDLVDQSVDEEADDGDMH